MRPRLVGILRLNRLLRLVVSTASLNRLQHLPGLSHPLRKETILNLAGDVWVEPPQDQGEVSPELTGGRTFRTAQDAIAVGAGGKQDLADEELCRRGDKLRRSSGLLRRSRDGFLFSCRDPQE